MVGKKGIWTIEVTDMKCSVSPHCKANVPLVHTHFFTTVVIALEYAGFEDRLVSLRYQRSQIH